MKEKNHDEGLKWQVGIWDRMSGAYVLEVDKRFVPVIDCTLARAHLESGQRVLDLGTGTGAVAERAASVVGPDGHVVGVDISPDMLAAAQRRMAQRGITNVSFREGSAEDLPVEDGSIDVVLASLSLMYVIDRAGAAREIVRVLRPQGRFVAAVWAGPEQCDIVRFQQLAGKFAGTPPVPGVGPGSLADPGPFVTQLQKVGMDTQVETETLGFDFDNFELAWDVLAGVTTAQLTVERQEEARAEVRSQMWPKDGGPRHFRNATHFIMGRMTK